MTIEDALFALADAVIGYWSEHGDVDRYMSEEKFNQALDACKKANPERYAKEIAPFTGE